MALKSFLQADILNILLHHWEEIQRAEVVSNSWPGSCIKEKATVPCGIAVSEPPHMSRGKTWKSLIVPEHLTMLRATWCPSKPCVGSQTGDTSDSPTPTVSELTEPPLTCKRHQPLWPNLHQHSPAPSRELCSSPSQKPAGSCLWLWSAPHTAQIRVWCSLGSEL